MDRNEGTRGWPVSAAVRIIHKHPACDKRMSPDKAGEIYLKLKRFLVIGKTPARESPRIRWEAKLSKGWRRVTFAEFLVLYGIEFVGAERADWRQAWMDD